jgi:hypothetical protein
VGTGLYLGMRSRAPSPAPNVALVPSQAPVASTPIVVLDAGATLVDPLANPAGYSAAQTKATARLKAAIEAKRAVWVAKCWKPSAAASPTPAREKFDVRALFDAKGRRTDFAAALPVAKSRADVAKCLSENPLDVSIEPTGALLGVQHSFELP